MNPEYEDYKKFPVIKAKQWSSIFPNHPSVVVDLISKMLLYSPDDVWLSFYFELYFGIFTSTIRFLRSNIVD